MDKMLLWCVPGKTCAESETRNPVTSARCLDDTIPRPRQILYNSEIGTFSNTFFHSPQGLPQLKRHIYLEARLSLLVPVSQAIVRPSLLSNFRSQLFPNPLPKKNSPEFSTLLSNSLLRLHSYSSKTAPLPPPTRCIKSMAPMASMATLSFSHPNQ